MSSQIPAFPGGAGPGYFADELTRIRMQEAGELAKIQEREEASAAAETEAQRQREVQEALSRARANIASMQSTGQPLPAIPGQAPLKPGEVRADYDPQKAAQVAGQIPQPEFDPSAIDPSITEEVTEVPIQGYRAVRMPNGRVVFTNMPGGYRGRGGEVLDEQASRFAARDVGMAGPTTGAPPPDPLNAASLDFRRLVETAAAAPGEPGQFAGLELSPAGIDEFGRPMATPGWYQQEAARTAEAGGRLSALGALARAQIPPETLHRWNIQEKQRANVPLQVAEYTLNQLRHYDDKIDELPELARKQFPNDSALQQKFIKEGTARYEGRKSQVERSIQSAMGIRPDVLAGIIAAQAAQTKTAVPAGE